MRRKDREILNIEEIKTIIDKTMILHLGLFDQDYPYIVPLHYGYDFSDGNIVFYMHCAKEGHKLDLIKKNPAACVEIENDIQTISGENVPCRYGAAYSSVVARGKIHVVSDMGEKIQALQRLMRHQTNRKFKITDTMADTVVVLKFVAESYAAKSRKPK